jgi:phospholipase C
VSNSFRWLKVFALSLALGIGLGMFLFLLSAPRPTPGAKDERVGVDARSSRRAATTSGMNLIQHIVLIVKENRTFDNMFGTYPGANGATTGVIHTGQVIKLGHTPDRTPRDLCHTWKCALNGMDGGKMDKFDLSGDCNLNGDYLCYTELYQSDMPNYWTYAQNFVLADNMFSSEHTESYPNHLYTIAAQSADIIDNPSSSKAKGQWGCDAVAGTTATALNPVTGALTSVFPCFGFQTLADLLGAAGISWKYYAPCKGQSGYIWSAYRSINQVFNSPLWKTNVPADTTFVTDAQTGKLPAVSWLVTGQYGSEHPPASTCQGENWTVEQINAVMQGPEWNSTAIFVTWDDYGGFYDHAPPPSPDVFGLGPRVPLLIISPYAVKGRISHTQYEFSSFLKFAEDRYGLATLTARDAAANDMTDSFNFSQTPLPPLVLQTRTCP